MSTAGAHPELSIAGVSWQAHCPLSLLWQADSQDMAGGCYHCCHSRGDGGLAVMVGILKVVGLHQAHECSQQQMQPVPARGEMP